MKLVNAKKGLFFCFMLMIFSSICFASSNTNLNPDSGIIPNGSLFENQSDYGPLINSFMIGIALMVAASSVLFMVARAMKRSDFEVTIKSEIYQVIISIIWALFFIAIALTADQITRQYTPGGETTFDIAQNYIDRVTCIASVTTMKMEGMKMGAQYLAGMRLKYYAGAWGFSMMAFPGFEVIERAIDMILILITPFTASLFAQGIGLQLIHATAMTIILPAGLILRIFPPFRDAGSFLIATAFAFYFVFPFCYVIDAQVVGYMYREEFGHGICEGWNEKGRDNANTDYFTKPGEFFDNMSVNLLPSVSRDLLSFPTHLSYVAFQAVFLPAINMIMVITFVKAELKFFSQKME